MSDERKEWSERQYEMLERLDEWFDVWKRENSNSNKRKSHYYTIQHIKHLIQQKPEIDDMEKYVEEKARGFYGKLYPHLGIDLDMLEIIEEFITQIIRDVKGRG